MPFLPKFSSADLRRLLDANPSTNAMARSPGNIEKLDTMLRDIEDDKYAIQTEIYSLQARIHAHEQRLRNIEDVDARRVRWHRSALSEFPAEVLRLIFEELCLQNSFASWSQLYALRLCRVCSSWRAIVLRDGLCWSTFHISAPPVLKDMSNATQEASLYRLTTHFLTHSGSFPLDIHISCEMLPSETMMALLRETHRWRDVYLRGSHEIFSKPAVQTNHLQSFPLLQSLTIREGSDGVRTLLEQFNNFTGVPSGVLRNLTFSNRISTHICRAFSSHWPHITSLTLHYSSPEEIIRAVRACEDALESLHLFDIVSSDQDAEPAAVTLPALRTLTVNLGFGSHQLKTKDLPHLLSPLTLPALTCLKLYAGEGEAAIENEWPAEVVEQFFQRSSFPLQHLVLSELGIKDVQLLSLLELLSETLQTLNIVETTANTPGYTPNMFSQQIEPRSSVAPASQITQTLTTTFLQALNPNRRTSSNFLQELMDFHITRRSGLAFDRRTFVETVVSRLAESLPLDGIAPLRRVSLTISTPDHLRSDGRPLKQHRSLSYNREMYEQLAGDVRVFIADEDPEQRYEKTI
ncbi:hypothetical protein BT96DRAFT_995644 [Gymnopus androsaceus JB14]|uniref:F-box domain-containing protein n=1 Tax=Gymnopus androsaceus JB14 TaxID=1447944 RepID=A0A6A4HG52_9AGAR|nr:hypothetical protein BT96DRAFT_995644 [Gymnopus androsaceus JB14]